MCEGIARVGNGICLMATTSEDIIGKCSRLVRASRTYILKNVTLDWGARPNIFDGIHTGNSDFKSVFQAPSTLPAMFPWSRFIVFALIENREFVPPKEVVIRGQRDGSGEMLNFSVPVQLVPFSSQYHPRPLVQTLAARCAITELEDAEKVNSSVRNDNTIIRLGTQYQLASTYTSFIAVDKRAVTSTVERAKAQELSVKRDRSLKGLVLSITKTSPPKRTSPEASRKRRCSLQLPSFRGIFCMGTPTLGIEGPRLNSHQFTFSPGSPQKAMHRRAASLPTSASKWFKSSKSRAETSSSVLDSVPPQPPPAGPTSSKLPTYVETYDPTEIGRAHV